MTPNIDMEKAYDRLRCDFIQDSLMDAQIPTSLVRLIMQCITTSTIHVLWNEGYTKDFIPLRDVCQGDPMSPYLFVLTMERLGRAIQQAVSNGSWKPIVLERGGHLCLTYSLLMT